MGGHGRELIFIATEGVSTNTEAIMVKANTQANIKRAAKAVSGGSAGTMGTEGQETGSSVPLKPQGILSICVVCIKL